MYQSIKNWALDDRPREKLISKGEKALSDAEILAILIGSGTKTKSALDLAREILSTSENNLSILAKKSMSQLCKHKGIGPSRAVTILAALELTRRCNNQTLLAPENLKNSRASYLHLKPFFLNLNHEEVYLCLLSRKNIPIHVQQIHKGGMNSSIVDSRIIFQLALEYKASGIIIAHNHPSGSIQPSPEDDKITTKIVQIGKLMEIPLIDHLIITDNSYFSYAENNRLE